MIRIAATGDVHVGLDSGGCLRPELADLPEQADVLLIAGDLTRHGDPDEARVLAAELENVGVPVVCVLGNHDHHLDRADEITTVMQDAGVAVLDGQTFEIRLSGRTLGIAGTKGFGGGFEGACATEFGEPEMKAFVGHTRRIAERLEASLASLDTDHRVALLHYAPVDVTLRGERPEIYPFLGSYLLAEAIDRAGADLVVHGHAHVGTERGETAAGVPVRNVAQPVIRHAYNVYVIGNGTSAAAVSVGASHIAG